MPCAVRVELRLAVLCLCAAVGGLATAAAQQKPNIVLIYTDDQDLILGGTAPMAKLQAHLAGKGVTLDNFFVNTPVCCPSRAELMSGRYNHNLRMPAYSDGGCMHMNSNTSEYKAQALAPALQRAGYRTALFGKYLNSHDSYCTSRPYTPPIPPGWDRWFSSCGGIYYYNLWADQGVLIDSDPALTGPPNVNGTNYNPSVVGNQSVSWLKEQLAEEGHPPLFTVIAPHAPHVGQHGSGGADVLPTPPMWYSTEFADKKAPRVPNYNFSGVNHHALIASQPPILPGAEEDWIDELFRNRWRTLLAVDDIVEAVVLTFEAAGEADNTFFIYTSDHGQNLGNLRLPSCKLNVYEHDVRVPFMVRGPGIAQDSHASPVITNVDVAPTILAMAGQPKVPIMDGRSFLPFLQGQTIAWNNTALIEYNTLGIVVRGAPVHHHNVDDFSNTYRALRVVDAPSNTNFLYAEFTDPRTNWNFTNTSELFYEYFDLVSDEWQMHNVYAALPDTRKADLHASLETAFHCSAETCH